MTVTVKNKSALTVPTEVQRRAGIKAGDRLEFKVSGGIIRIIPKLPKSEYTARQRKILDAQLAEGLEDIRKGRVSPKYNTVDEMLASLKRPGKNSARPPKTRGR